MPISEFDMERCPNCEGTRILSFWHAETLPYGKDHNTVQIFFAMPLKRCLNDECKQIWSDHNGERAQEQALARYRLALCPTPNINTWIESVKDRAMAGVPVSLLEQVVTAWELYRTTMLEAGAGVEPAATGV